MSLAQCVSINAGVVMTSPFDNITHLSLTVIQYESPVQSIYCYERAVIGRLAGSCFDSDRYRMTSSH